MAEIETFETGDRVFIAQSSPDDWPGVEILESTSDSDSDSDSDTTRVKVVYTNGIPGYELGQIMEVSADLAAFRQLTVDSLIEARDADKQDDTQVLECRSDECDNPVIAVLVYIGQVTTIGEALCRECATCIDCDEVGTIFDFDFTKPWCERHASQFSGEETVTGPDVVLIDSDRYREMLAEGAAR